MQKSAVVSRQTWTFPICPRGLCDPGGGGLWARIPPGHILLVPLPLPG